MKMLDHKENIFMFENSKKYGERDVWIDVWCDACVIHVWFTRDIIRDVRIDSSSDSYVIHAWFMRDSHVIHGVKLRVKLWVIYGVISCVIHAWFTWLYEGNISKRLHLLSMTS